VKSGRRRFFGFFAWSDTLSGESVYLYDLETEMHRDADVENARRAVG